MHRGLSNSGHEQIFFSVDKRVCVQFQSTEILCCLLLILPVIGNTRVTSFVWA